MSRKKLGYIAIAVNKVFLVFQSLKFLPESFRLIIRIAGIGKTVAEKWLSADGRVDKTLAFDYNPLGHLTKVDDGVTVFDYDYQNRLVRRNDELFVHDGWQIACSINNGKIGHRYLWGAAQDELLAMDDCWALRDHLNTVRKIVDAKGCVVASLEYNAFGALVNATGDKPLFRYTLLCHHLVVFEDLKS